MAKRKKRPIGWTQDESAVVRELRWRRAGDMTVHLCIEEQQVPAGDDLWDLREVRYVVIVLRSRRGDQQDTVQWVIDPESGEHWRYGAKGFPPAKSVDKNGKEWVRELAEGAVHAARRWAGEHELPPRYSRG